MLIEVIIEKSEEIKLEAFETQIIDLGFEKIKIGKDSIFMGPNKHKIRVVIRKNVTNDRIKIITDEPNILKDIDNTFNVYNINVI